MKKLVFSTLALFAFTGLARADDKAPVVVTEPGTSMAKVGDTIYFEFPTSP
jgi:hypothetical protein